jgi:hypothetical protein
MRFVVVIEGSFANDRRIANVGRRDNGPDTGHDGARCSRDIGACSIVHGPRRLRRPLRIVVPE